jgi:catechol 2,3-dioxygenase
MSFSVEHIDHVEVFVRDLDRAARWYGEVLGLREIHRWDPEPVFIGAGETCLALFQASTDAPAVPAADAASRPHWHRVAWHTDPAGFEAAQVHLSKLGITFRGPVDHEIAWSIYFNDPDGNPLEITCDKAPADAGSPG